jgi:hypothetical protein
MDPTKEQLVHQILCNFLSRVKSDEESWLYDYDLERKQKYPPTKKSKLAEAK